MAFMLRLTLKTFLSYLLRIPTASQEDCINLIFCSFYYKNNVTVFQITKLDASNYICYSFQDSDIFLLVSAPSWKLWSNISNNVIVSAIVNISCLSFSSGFCGIC